MRIAFRGLLYCLLAAALSEPAHAAVALDQSALVDWTIGPVSGSWIAQHEFFGKESTLQTFTAGVSGSLDRIELQVAQYSGMGTFRVSVVDNLTVVPAVYIPDADASQQAVLTDFSVIGQFDFDLASLPTQDERNAGALLSVITRDSGISVRAGSKYGILMEITSVTSPWMASADSAFLALDEATGVYHPLAYDGGENYRFGPWGEFYARSGQDRGFQTFVDVAPVPEPESWAILVVGFGLVGGFARAAGSPSDKRRRVC